MPKTFGDIQHPQDHNIQWVRRRKTSDQVYFQVTTTSQADLLTLTEVFSSHQQGRPL